MASLYILSGLLGFVEISRNAIKIHLKPLSPVGQQSARVRPAREVLFRVHAALHRFF